MPGLFLITGDNVPERERFVQALIMRELKGEPRENALRVFHASESGPGEVIDAAASSSLFGGASVTLVRGAEELLSDTLRALSQVLPLPPKNTLTPPGKQGGPPAH